jgi:hypothetical protein
LVLDKFTNDKNEYIQKNKNSDKITLYTMKNRIQDVMTNAKRKIAIHIKDEKVIDAIIDMYKDKTVGETNETKRCRAIQKVAEHFLKYKLKIESNDYGKLKIKEIKEIKIRLSGTKDKNDKILSQILIECEDDETADVIKNNYKNIDD